MAKNYKSNLAIWSHWKKPKNNLMVTIYFRKKSSSSLQVERRTFFLIDKPDTKERPTRWVSRVLLLQDRPEQHSKGSFTQ